MFVIWFQVRDNCWQSRDCWLIQNQKDRLSLTRATLWHIFFYIVTSLLPSNSIMSVLVLTFCNHIPLNSFIIKLSGVVAGRQQKLGESVTMMAAVWGPGQHTPLIVKMLVKLEVCDHVIVFFLQDEWSWTAGRVLYHIIHRPVLQIRLVIRSTQMKEIHPPQVPGKCCYCQWVHKRQLSLDEPVSCWRAGAANLPGGTRRQLTFRYQT